MALRSRLTAECKAGRFLATNSGDKQKQGALLVYLLTRLNICLDFGRRIRPFLPCLSKHRATTSCLIFACVLLIAEVAQSAAQRTGGFHGTKTVPVFKSDNAKDTRLLEAAYVGDVDQVRNLIAGGADPNARQARELSFSNETVLCLTLGATSAPYTGIEKYREVLTVLLDHGANIHACRIPINQNTPALVNLLLAHGADANEGDPLLGAIGMWHTKPSRWTECIRALLNAGADVKGDNGPNALQGLVFATGPYPPNSPSQPSETDFMTLVKLLAAYGARVNGTIAYLGDKDCGPALKVNGAWQCPVWSPKPPHCSFPTELSPPERLQHVDTGVTPLMQAARWPQGLPLVKALLAAGADPTIRDSFGCSALDLPGSAAIHDAIEAYLRTRPRQSALIRSGPACNPPPSPFKVAASTPPTPGVTTVQPDTLDKLDFVCFRGARASRTNVVNRVAPEFGGNKVLKITIEDPSKMLSHDAVAETRREVLFAIGLWRRICFNCGIANAAVVLMDENLYVDEQLWNITQAIKDYGQFPKGGPSLLATGSPGPYTLQAIFANIRTNTSVPLAKYVVVNRSDPSIQRLCSAESDRVPAELQGIRDASQCTSQQLVLSTLHIRMLNGPTHCDGDPTVVVGCEVGGLTVELNGRDFTYVKHNNSESVFGKGDAKVDFQVVILHETGHWAGVAVHLRTPKNIMSEYVEDCHCIDQAVVDQLAEPYDASTRVGNIGLLHKVQASSEKSVKLSHP